jgi:hypothetical protein
MWRKFEATSMQYINKERVQQLRLEIAAISQASQVYINVLYNTALATAEHENRYQRLQEILDELQALRNGSIATALGSDSTSPIPTLLKAEF